MDITPIKKYAPRAYKQFRLAIQERAQNFGIFSDKIIPLQARKGSLQIGDFTIPLEMRSVIEEMHREFSAIGYDEQLERISYTWFNRLVALRYMEIHKLLPLCLLEKEFRLICCRFDSELADNVLFLYEDRDTLIRLLQEREDPELMYRSLLIEECNKLHQVMPFLFSEITGSIALLLPDNLLEDGSIIDDLVTSLEPALWREGVEIIGWLYQYYTEDSKRNKVTQIVEVSDIPAATQLFTPKWIVKYLVQNTLGSTWLEGHPSSALKGRWQYLIPQTFQTEQTKQITEQYEFNEDTPLNLTVLDPACGSGHILVEAYDTIRDMYLQAGYDPKDIPTLILQHNLFGLDIDERATQMAGFSLLMKSTADDPNIINKALHISPQVFSFTNCHQQDMERISRVLIPTGERELPHPLPEFAELYFPPPQCIQLTDELISLATNKIILKKEDIMLLEELFRDAEAFGSLITIPEDKISTLLYLLMLVNYLMLHGSLQEKRESRILGPLIQKALILASKFDCVLANPPYMGLKYQPQVLREFLKKNYYSYHKDLFSAFMMRNITFTKTGGYLGFMTPYVWMFISSYEHIRRLVLDTTSITTMVKLEYSAFEAAVVPICTFTLRNLHLPEFRGAFLSLADFKGGDNQGSKVIEAIQYPECGWLYYRSNESFFSIPGAPISFWLNEEWLNRFAELPRLGDVAPVRVGMQTSNNEKFLRRWFEVNFNHIGFNFKNRNEAANSKLKWFPYNKGGKYRRWFGNQHYVIDFQNDGEALSGFNKSKGYSSGFGDGTYQFREGITWSDVSSTHFGARYLPSGFLSDISGSGIFPDKKLLPAVACYLCSDVADNYVHALNPTLHFQTGNIANLPFPADLEDDKIGDFKNIFDTAVSVMSEEWGHSEENWQFKRFPMIKEYPTEGSLRLLTQEFLTYRARQRSTLQNLELANDTLFYEIFNLEKPSDIDSSNRTTTYPLWTQKEVVERLLSYIIGCVIGRYNPKHEGVRVELEKVDSDTKQFRAEFGYVSLTNPDGIDKSCIHYVKKFIEKYFGKKYISENLKFITNVLDDTNLPYCENSLQEYLANDFIPRHIKQYSRRPIYWQFISGKLGVVRVLVPYHFISQFMLKSIRDNLVDSVLTVLRANPEGLNNEIVELQSFRSRLTKFIDNSIVVSLDDGIAKNYDRFSSILSHVPLVKSGIVSSGVRKYSVAA
jgi:hypothetical protein